jgi:hypothetical protein
MSSANQLSRFLIVAAVMLTAGPAVAAQPPSGSVAGVVSFVGPDGQPFVLPGVTVALTCGRDGVAVTGVSNERGEFRFGQVPPGVCSVVAELQGFRSGTTTLEVTAAETTEAALRLELDTLREEVNVAAGSDASPDANFATHVERMTTHEMQTAPLANQRFQDALPLIPGVVRGPDGLLNIGGSRSNQSALMFNSANGTDPVTGEDAIELPLDAVSSVQVRGIAYAPEFGHSVGAVTMVETQQGGAQWHFQVNDLEPRVRRRGGEFRGIESFTPRFTAGGPLVTGKISVLESVQYQFTRTQVFGLPPLESDTQVESVESFSRMDWIASPRQRVTASAAFAPRKTTYAGLNTFNPQRVTPDIRTHGVLASVNDQIVVGGSGLFDVRVSLKEFDATIQPSRGHDVMILAPEINFGSYFNDQDRTSRRLEWLNTYSLAPLGPSHLARIGAGVTEETFDGIHSSRPVDIVRRDGTRSEETTFVGDTALSRTKTMLVGYAQDAWTVHPRLTVQYGVRYDRDSITGDVNLAPRGAFTVLVSGDGRTVVRGGAGLFYDPIPLNVASFDQMQARVVTRFGPDGETIVGAPTMIANVVTSDVHTPRSVVWNVDVDREWIRNLFVRIGYQQRENRFESVLDPTTLAGTQVLQLLSDGRARYREGQITTRYQFHGTDQIVASYTRSSAVGNLNDFNTYFGNIENPVIRADQRAPLPWDAPNRFLIWSHVSLPAGFSVFPLLDVRSGFPLSIVDEDRNFVGARNGGRFPTFVSLDTQISKRLRLFGHNATIGLKVFNVTNHFNPRDYQGNLASAQFGGFANGVGRSFRGRWIFEF